MDPSALIFVALAVAWAVYLIPKALEHHEEGARSRTVEQFSRQVRVVARREVVDRRTATLVTPGQALPTQRASTRVATRRRRRVLGTLLLANAALAGVAAFGVVGWVWMAIPGGLVVVWLVMCRLMVRREHAVTVPVATADADPLTEEVPVVPAVAAASDDELVTDPTGRWDPVPVTLPTYVSKPTAPRRSVRQIDLDSTGVWSSGRNQADSDLVREAEAAEKATRDAARTASRRASGS